MRTALTKREEEIARLLASGLSNREVGQRLSLSPTIVEHNLARVYEKLGISTRVELMFYVLSNNKGPKSEDRGVTEKALRMGA